MRGAATPDHTRCSVLWTTLTLFSGLSIPNEVHACSTNMSCSLKDPGSSSNSMRSRAVSFPYHRGGRKRMGEGRRGEGRGGEGVVNCTITAKYRLVAGA